MCYFSHVDEYNALITTDYSSMILKIYNPDICRASYI